MAIALPSRPEVYVAGTVVGSRNITSKSDRSQVIGASFTIESLNGDRLQVTAWASDAADLVGANGLSAGEQVLLVAYPANDGLSAARRANPGDADRLLSASGLALSK